MKFLFILLFLAFPGLSSACNSASERIKMMSVLYKDAEFRQFTCGDRENCTPKVMQNLVEFDVLRIPKISQKFCLVQTTLSVKNRYIGIFSISKKRVHMEMIVFGLGVLPYYKEGISGISVDLLTDNETQAIERDKYQWTGRGFSQLDSELLYGDESIESR